MIVARRCLLSTRVPLLHTTKCNSLQNKLPCIYSRIVTTWLNSRFVQNHANIQNSELDMDNPARTSTVVLENYYVQVATFYKDPSYKVTRSFSKCENGLWACDLSVKWPMPNQFHAEQPKKTEAARMASWLALEWLKSHDKINAKGKPLLVTDHSTDIHLNISPKLIQNVHALSTKYLQEIEPFYQTYENEHKDEVRRYFDDYEFPTYANVPSNLKDDRDDLLAYKLTEMPPKCALPIDELSDRIVETIESNRVVVIKGATGSGKTTRVPQLILDHYIKNNMGSQCNIMVTQPRRISALSLATRIASERAENLGFSVGHHVRFSVCYPPLPGSIVFATCGILLQKLLIDPTLNDISHVIIDEAHERDLNIDLLLMLTKELLQRNDKIKIVIMSATINAEFFQQYYNNCPLLSIPGFMYDVQTHYIDDNDMKQHFDKPFYEYDQKDVDNNLIVHIVQWIHGSRPPGAILVFLPGWSDISSIESILEENNEMFVLIAHSKMKVEQQELIFQKPPQGKRKVILATNIAESSITIPDVIYVVDSGLQKEVGTFKGVKGLANVWISKAVANQRLGRAGRVAEGECFRLYSKNKYELFDPYPIPEILKVSLESLLMRIKVYSDDKLVNTLCKFPNTPPTHAVMNAIRYLQGINVFDENESLTPLGRRVAMFGLHPLLSVALVYSVFFKCCDSMLFCTSVLNNDASIYAVRTKSSDRRNLLAEQHSTNDLVAAYRIYKTWRANSLTSSNIIHFNEKAFRTFKKVLRLNLDYLFKAHLVGVDDIVKYDIGESGDDEETLLAPALFSATGRLAVNDMPYLADGKTNHFWTTIEGLKVQVSNDSVNFKNSQSSSFVTYYKLSTTEQGFLRIFDTAQISPLTVVLFSSLLPNICITQKEDKLRLAYRHSSRNIVGKKEDLMAILHLREMIQNSLKFFISHHNSYVDEPELIAQFKEDMVSVLKSLVRENEKYI